MGAGRSAGRSRAAPHALVELADVDRQVLSLLSEHRVVTQVQLARLLAEVPERTLRYRTRRLHRLGLVGRTRPYRDAGSAPFHLWPTRRGDALVRGERLPRGGKRAEPNRLFVAHAAALTELYVALVTAAPDAGLALRGFEREEAAREPFERAGKKRAIAPDALAVLADDEARELRLFCEVDMGTMSHRRLRLKAGGYAAYASVGAWRERHRFCPALVFLTTGEQRAAAFLRALGTAQADEGRWYQCLVAAGGSMVLAPERALEDAALLGPDCEERVSLRELLEAARRPYEREQAERAAERRRRDDERRRLLEEPDALRAFLAERRRTLRDYLDGLDKTANAALSRLLTDHGELGDLERSTLLALATDLETALSDLAPIDIPRAPAGEVVDALEHLGVRYRDAQLARVRELVTSHGEGPALCRARTGLEAGGLFTERDLDALADDAARDERGRDEQRERRDAYLDLREREARALARQQGALRRFTAERAELYPVVDERWLRVCGGCEEIAYPSDAEGRAGAARRRESVRRCHYCGAIANRPYDAEREGTKPDAAANVEAGA